jgi:hypothetical protein
MHCILGAALCVGFNYRRPPAPVGINSKYDPPVGKKSKYNPPVGKTLLHIIRLLYGKYEYLLH